MRFVDEVVKATKKDSFEGPNQLASTAAPNVERLSFRTDDLVKDTISKVKKGYLDQLASLSFKYFILGDFGRADCKRVGIGPDSVMQLAIQIAYHRLNGKFAPTYESCTTSLYRHGRTETLRPLTMEMRELATQMNRTYDKENEKELIQLFKNCSKKHLELTKSALYGKSKYVALFSVVYTQKVLNQLGKASTVIFFSFYIFRSRLG